MIMIIMPGMPFTVEDLEVLHDCHYNHSFQLSELIKKDYFSVITLMNVF